MANDVYQLTLLGRSADQFFENVLHFKSNETAGADPVAGAAELIEGFFNNCLTPLADCMCVDSNINGMKAKRVNNGGGPTFGQSITATPGTVAGTSATSATASLLKVPFQRGTKFYTGKMFIPGLSESVLTGNVLGAGQLTKLGTFAASLIAGFTESPFTYDFVVWSRKVSLPFIPFDVTVSTKVGIQRRRLTPYV